MKNKLPKQLRFETLMKETETLAIKSQDKYGKFPKEWAMIDRNKLYKEDKYSIIL